MTVAKIADPITAVESKADRWRRQVRSIADERKARIADQRDQSWHFSPWRRLVSCTHGASMVEWALVAPVATAVGFVFLELSMMLFVNVLAEGGLREAARYGITGYVPPGKTREEFIVEIVKDHALSFLDGEDTQITTKVYPSFARIGDGEKYTDTNGNGQYDAGEPYIDENGNGQYDSDIGEEGPGGPESIVEYTITYTYTLMTPFLAPLVGNGDGKITFTAKVVVQNEPY